MSEDYLNNQANGCLTCNCNSVVHIYRTSTTSSACAASKNLCSLACILSQWNIERGERENSLHSRLHSQSHNQLQAIKRGSYMLMMTCPLSLSGALTSLLPSQCTFSPTSWFASGSQRKLPDFSHKLKGVSLFVRTAFCNSSLHSADIHTVAATSTACLHCAP